MSRLQRSWQRFACGLLASLAGMGALAASPGVQDEAQLKAAFIYRFAQFTQWPPPPLREVVYCLAAGSDLQEPLRAIVQRSQGSMPTRLQVLQSPGQLGQCHLLVLDMTDRIELNRWQAALSDEPVLVVAATPEAFKGAAVFALTVEPNGLSFRINNTEAKRRGLALSSQVLKLAREVR